MALTHKQEMFCQEIVSGKNMSDAYRAVYNTGNMTKPSVNAKAYELMQNVHITARISDIRRPALVSAALTAESHMLELKRLRDLALDAGKHSEAIRAEELRGKVAGLYITKVETGDAGAFAALDANAKVSALNALKAELDRRGREQLGMSGEVTDVEVKG